MYSVRVGEPLIKLIMVAYPANTPVLLWGKHGVGKSAILKEVARRLGIRHIARDLSLMEPTDLAGFPQVLDERMHYAAPAFLPTDGRGLLAFEEMNRAEKYMQAPCLQLLTARLLNDYALPDGWLPCAALNPVEDGYVTAELDEALKSRFLNVNVVPDVDEWTRWARDNEVHDKVIEFVEASPDVFEDPVANPRAWAYVSAFLKAWEEIGGSPTAVDELLAAGLAGFVDDVWSTAFLRYYAFASRALDAVDIIENYGAHRPRVLRLLNEKRLDLVATSFEALRRGLQKQSRYEDVIGDARKTENVERFLGDLPADLRHQAASWIAERGFEFKVRRRRGRGN